MLESLQTALANMKSALSLLDDAEAPDDIGAHLDLAICRLESFLKKDDAPSESSS